MGADVAVYSAHKFLGGPTAGIVAGEAALVRAAFLQNGGIGRGMKVGKEGMAGAIAALEAWEKRDHDARARAGSAAICSLWRERLSRWPGDRVEDHAGPDRQSAGPAEGPCRSARRRASPPGTWPTRLRRAIRRSSCATMRSSGAVLPRPVQSASGRGERSWPTGWTRSSIGRAGPTRRSRRSLADRRRRQVERLLRWPD